MRRLRRALSSRAARLLDQSVAAAIFSSILHGATLPTEGRQGGGRRDGLDWWPAKGPRRPPGPGPLRTLSARSSPRLSSAPAQDDVERTATDSTPGLDPRARPRGDPDTFGRGRALRALRPPCRFAFAPGLLLGPAPLAAALPVQRLHRVRFGRACLTSISRPTGIPVGRVS